MKKIRALFRTTALTVCSISAIASTSALADDKAHYKGKTITQKEATQIAINFIGEGTVTDTGFKESYSDNDGKPIYEIDVTKTDGTEYEVKIDAQDGIVIASQKDD